MNSASTILATTAYLLVVGLGAALFAQIGHSELILEWFGLAGLGGIGASIKTQLADVARTVGTQHTENGTSLTLLEKYTHDSVHTIKNDLTAIKGSLVIAGLMPVGAMPSPPPSSSPTPTPPVA